MRLSRQSALALALFLGILAAGLAFFALRNRQPEPRPVAEKVQVPVPRQSIPANTDLTPEMFDQLSLDADKVPKDVLSDIRQVDDRITLRELDAGDPVPLSAVVKRSISRALAYGIPENYRALTVAVDDVSGVANFIRPGDYIDLIGLFTDSSGELSVAITVLQDTLVLAVNSATGVQVDGKEAEEKTDEAAKSRRAEQDRMVTLAVTPHEAQLLALSDFRGELRMALRRTGDHSLEILARSQSWSLVGGYPQVAGLAPNGRPGHAETMAPPPDELPGWARTWGMPPVEASRAQPVAPPPATQPAVEQPRKPSVEVIRGFTRENVEPAQ